MDVEKALEAWGCLTAEEIYEYPNFSSKETEERVSLHLKQCELCRVMIETKEEEAQPEPQVSQRIWKKIKKRQKENFVKDKKLGGYLLDKIALKFELALEFVKKYFPDEIDIFEMTWETVAGSDAVQLKMGWEMGIMGMGSNASKSKSTSIIPLFLKIDPEENWKEQLLAEAKDAKLSGEINSKLKEFIA